MTSEGPARAGQRSTETSRLAGRTLWNLSGIVVTNVSRLLALAIVGQVGGAATLGNVQTAVSSANLAAIAGPTSIGSAAGRYLPRSGPDSRDVAWRLLHHGRALGLLFAVLFAGAFLPFYGPVMALAILVLTFVLCQWVVARGIAISDGTRLRSMTIVEVIGALILVVVMAALVLMETSWHLYLLAFALMQVPLILSVWLRYRRRGAGPGPVGVGYRHFVWWGVVGSFASGGLVHLTTVATNGLGGATEAGHLAAGLLLVSPLGMLFAALSQVALPWLSLLRDEDVEARGRQLSAGIHCVVGSVLLVLVPLGPWLGRLIFGPEVRLDQATVIAVGGATLALSGRLGAVPVLSLRGHEEMRRMAVLSYAGLGTALLVWGATWTVRGDLPALYAGTGYALGAAVVTVLITAVAHGTRNAGRSAAGMLSWLVAVYGVTYASAHLGAPAMLTVALGLGLWVVSVRAGARNLMSWARVWAGDR